MRCFGHERFREAAVWMPCDFGLGSLYYLCEVGHWAVMAWKVIHLLEWDFDDKNCGICEGCDGVVYV